MFDANQNRSLEEAMVAIDVLSDTSIRYVEEPVSAAVGGEGLVELDSNSNPMRTDLCELDLGVSEGHVRVPDGHGTGVNPVVDALRRYQA